MGVVGLGIGAKAGLFGLASELTTAELISGGFTVASGIASISSGFAQKKEADLQAKFAELGAQRETLEGKRVALIALEEGNAAEGRQAANLAASGIEIGQGTAAVTLSRTSRTARFNVELAELSGASGAAAELARAAALRAKGRSSITGGFIAAAGGVQSFATFLIAVITSTSITI